MPVSRGEGFGCLFTRGPSLRESVHERGKTQKWQSRSLGPPRVLTRASPRVRTCLGPRSVPSTYAFLRHPVSFSDLSSPLRALSSTLSAMVSLRGTFAHRDEPRDLFRPLCFHDFLVSRFLLSYRLSFYVVGFVRRKEKLFIGDKFGNCSSMLKKKDFERRLV